MNTQEVEQVEEETSLHDELAQAMEETPEVEPEVPEEIQDLLEAPEFFRAEHKDLFSKLNDLEGGRDYQQGWLDQYAEGQESFNKKSQELGDWKQDRTTFNSYQQAISPMLEAWKFQGVDPAIGMSQLVSYSQAMQQDPKGTLMNLASQYGVDLEKAFEEQPYIDPSVRTLQQQNSQLQQQAQQTAQWQQQWQQDQQNQKNQRDIDGFKTSNEHFDLVENDMANLINMGQAKDLQSAYDLAIKYNPEVQAINHKNEIAQKQADVKKAKSATARVASKTNTAPETEMTLREQLASNMSE